MTQGRFRLRQAAAPVTVVSSADGACHQNAGYDPDRPCAPASTPPVAAVPRKPRHRLPVGAIPMPPTTRPELAYDGGTGPHRVLLLASCFTDFRFTNRQRRPPFPQVPHRN